MTWERCVVSVSESLSEYVTLGVQHKWCMCVWSGMLPDPPPPFQLCILIKKNNNQRKLSGLAPTHIHYGIELHVSVIFCLEASVENRV